MDPLTAATTLATIVGLIGQFKGERSERDDGDFKVFLEWLLENQHEQLVELLNENQAASQGLESLIREDNAIVLEKLEALNSALTIFASSIGGLSVVAKALNPNSVLSDQALSILSQFESAGASKILESHSMDGPSYMFLNGKSGEIEFSEEQFLEDDFRVLCEYGLLRQDYNSQGTTMFRYTRSASNLIKNLGRS